jgi:CO/xanthine dehydrogenase Mo-binding subunit
MLHVKLVLSDVPHGHIKKIDTHEAENPGVVKIYHCFNTPRTQFNSQKWFVGQKGVEDQQIFSETVRYVGEPVAAVAGVDKKSAADGAAKVKIEYQKLPHVIDPEEALGGKVVIHPETPASSLELGCGNPSEMEQIFSRAALVVEDRIETQKIHHAALETHVCMASVGADGRVTVYSPCQIVYSVRMIVAKALNLPLHRVRVIQMPVGGSFGGKQEVTFEPLCAFIARDTGSPVRVELNRRESILSTRTRTKTVGYVRTAVDPEGRIAARDVRMIVDTGAYMSNGAVISSAMGRKVFRLYRIPTQRYRASVVHTNTPVAGAARGYGSPQVHAVTEIHFDHVAKRLGVDPVEFRLKHLVHPYDSDPSGGPPLGNARIIDCLVKGAEEFGWEEKWRRPRDSGRWRRGVGMACVTHVNGYYGAYQDFSTMTLRMPEDGSLVLHASLHDLGQGVKTIIKQIVAEVMEIDPAWIVLPETDTDTSPYDIGCQASRVTHVCGACAKKVAEGLRRLLVSESARRLECSPKEIVLSDGMVWSLRTPDEKKTYGEMASLIQQRSQIELIRSVTYHSPANPGSYGAGFAEVRVDILTGRVRIEDVVSVFDVGKAINPDLLEGQIHGGIQMGIGLALSEEIGFDLGTGQPRGDSLRKYHVVNAPDMPGIRIFLIEKGEDYGPYGAKSIGEIATIPITPALVNAVNHALGTSLTVLPLTPERIVASLSEAG